MIQIWGYNVQNVIKSRIFYKIVRILVSRTQLIDFMYMCRLDRLSYQFVLPI